VVFATEKTGTIYVDGKYIPVQAVAGGNSYNLNHTGDIRVDTDYDAAQDNGGFRTRGYGLRDVTAMVSRFDDLSKHFKDLLTNGEALLLEIRPGGSGDYARGWFVVEEVRNSGGLPDSEIEEISFALDGDPEAAFSWGS
jgi:hypothetical protein